MGKKVTTAKASFNQKEVAEKNAHIERRNAKEAAPFLEDPNAKFAAFEVDAKAAEEAGAEMAALNGDDLKAFATPASVLGNVEKHAAASQEKATAVKDAIKEQTKAASEVTPQSGGTNEAKKQLKTMMAKVEELTRKVAAIKVKISGKCKSLTAQKMEPTAEAIRKAAQSKG